jgi:hypothetical protein
MTGAPMFLEQMARQICAGITLVPSQSWQNPRVRADFAAAPRFFSRKGRPFGATPLGGGETPSRLGASVDREFGRLKCEYGRAPLRFRGLEDKGALAVGLAIPFMVVGGWLLGVLGYTVFWTGTHLPVLALDRAFGSLSKKRDLGPSPWLSRTI